MNFIRNYFRRNQNLRWMALVAWALIVLLFLLIFVVDSVADFSQMLVPCAEPLSSGVGCNTLTISSAEVAVLASWGLTTQTYAMAMIISPVILTFTYIGLGILILWRLGLTRLGLAVSLAFIVLPIYLNTSGNDWSGYNPVLFFLAMVAAIIGSAVAGLFLYIFPNGRFSPRWSYLPMTATVLLAGAQILEINGIITLSSTISSLLLITVISLLLFAGGLQVYRYLFDANASERQQTKWVIYGIVTFILGVFVWELIFGGVLTIPAGTTRLLANLVGWHLINSFLLLILPATITIAILRYKLWDIDLLIRRTLIYGVVSVALVSVYFGSVILWQQLFTRVTGQQSPLAIVISTLLIAALFNPLRRRIQEFIDRRFYRGKYDAQQTLAQFAATARDEVKIDRLTAELVRVVSETMQPESVSVWMNKNAERERTSQS